jgi:hypothetical protein
VFGIPVVNDQQAGGHEEDESSGSTAEHSDDDSEADSPHEMHIDDHEQGLLLVLVVWVWF